jgi:hypothetical protein
MSDENIGREDLLCNSGLTGINNLNFGACPADLFSLRVGQWKAQYDTFSVLSHGRMKTAAKGN